MSDLAIEIDALRKSYGDVEAVRGVDLQVRRGEVFALLGPNGAGKTTTVEIMEGHRSRTSGDVRVLGHDPAKRERDYREKIGIVLQETGIDPYLTVAEAIDLYRGYYPSPRSVDDVIEVVGLQEKRDVRVNKLSGGQQRRLDVAIGLAGDPELLFLDEPTTGFDPSARRNAWQMVKNLAALGKTVFLTTHYMDEAQSLADRVAIIVKGKIVVEGPPRSLIAGREEVTIISFRLGGDAPRLPSDLDGETAESDGSTSVTTREATLTLNRLTGWALENSVELTELQVARPTLEDVYLELAGSGAVGEEQSA